MNKKVMSGVGVLALLGIMYFVFSGLTGNVVAQMVEDGDEVKINLDGVSDEAQFFDYDGIKFFVVEANNGVVKTAFDACDVCFGAKKGYRQEGDDMVCNNCGNHYAISQLGTANLKGGGCWPGYLKSRVEDGYLVISKSDLETGRYRF